MINTSRSAGSFKPLSQDVFKICPGSSFEALCKAQGVTPGGAFQAGLQLALAKIAGRCMSVNEVVSIRYIVDFLQSASSYPVFMATPHFLFVSFVLRAIRNPSTWV